MSDEDTTQNLQNIVDKAKALSILNNVHALTPPIKKESDESNQITIIKALEVAPRLQALFLEARGLMWDKNEKKLIQISKPYMNVHGAWRLVQTIRHIAEEAEWANFEEEAISSYVSHFYAENLPYFTFWHEEFDLDPSDFNYVMTTLKMFILASFSKGKRGKYINVVGRTYSEEMLGKVMRPEEQKKKEGYLDGLNPFKRLV